MTIVELEMSRMTEWENWPSLCKYLAKQLIRGRLELVLGAGTSAHFGLPTWKSLIERLYSTHGATPSSGTETVQAEDFRNRYHKNDQAGFVSAVKLALYHDVKIGFDEMMSHHTLAGILSMLLAAGPGRNAEVVTFNWDNLLERYLSLHGRVALPVYEEQYWAQVADVTVFHPHGYLPYQDDVTGSRALIFDQLSYDKIMAKETIWKQVLLALFRTRTCMFIGLSCTDPHLLALLVQVKEEHASLVNGTLFWAVTFTTDAATEERWKERGVYPLILKDYAELPRRLFDISQAAIDARST